MGVSTLHHHFRVLTAMSPLKYQKQLRLQSARSLMLNNGLDAASGAFAVGYESATQFNTTLRLLKINFAKLDLKNCFKTGAHSIKCTLNEAVWVNPFQQTTRLSYRLNLSASGRVSTWRAST
jgi:AraC-like DNA-binding protein